MMDCSGKFWDKNGNEDEASCGEMCVREDVGTKQADRFDVEAT